MPALRNDRVAMWPAAEAVADAQEAEHPKGPRQLTQAVQDPSTFPSTAAHEPSQADR